MHLRVESLVASLGLVVVACGGDSAPRAEKPITGTVDLERPRSGPPDAGTRAGHGNEGAVATTSVDVFSFIGQVEPGSDLTVSDGMAQVEPSGRFTVAATSPRAGTKSLRLRATREGRRPWEFEVRLKRGAPARVTVPERDDEAPSAGLALSPVGGRAIAVRSSPSRAGERFETVSLPEPRFTATATVRDAKGGTARIRISVEAVTRCADETRREVQVVPPAQIVDIALPPGARAPVERQRSEVFELDAPAGCQVTGDASAEGTDAHGRQAVTAHVAFAYP